MPGDVLHTVQVSHLWGNFYCSLPFSGNQDRGMLRFMPEYNQLITDLPSNFYVPSLYVASGGKDQDTILRRLMEW